MFTLNPRARSRAVENGPMQGNPSPASFVNSHHPQLLKWGDISSGFGRKVKRSGSSWQGESGGIARLDRAFGDRRGVMVVVFHSLAFCTSILG